MNKNERITFRLTEQMKDELLKYCVKYNITLSALILIALKDYIDRVEEL